MMNRKYPLDRVDFKAEMLQSPNPLEPTDEKSNPIDEANKTYWVNQYDMLLTQWAFVGPLLLEPVAHGAHGHSIESMELVMYLWRVIGHFIGIHPRFNLFTDCNYALGYARCKIVLERVYAPTLTRLATAQGARMSMAIVKSMRYYNPYLSWSSVMRRAYELFNIDAKRINRLVREERERVRAERRGQTFESTWTTRPDSSLPATEEDDPICDENANTLSDEERRLKLIEAGYNDRYEVLVWDGLPVERIQLASTRDQLMNTLMRFQINCSFKWQPMRSFARNANLLRQRRAQANRNKLQKSCAKSYDDAWRFDKCPFSAAIGTVEYHDFSYVLSEKMKTKSS